jgi:hypothetical protein
MARSTESPKRVRCAATSIKGIFVIALLFMMPQEIALKEEFRIHDDLPTTLASVVRAPTECIGNTF